MHFTGLINGNLILQTRQHLWRNIQPCKHACRSKCYRSEPSAALQRSKVPIPRSNAKSGGCMWACTALQDTSNSPKRRQAVTDNSSYIRLFQQHVSGFNHFCTCRYGQECALQCHPGSLWKPCPVPYHMCCCLPREVSSLKFVSPPLRK